MAEKQYLDDDGNPTAPPASLNAKSPKATAAPNSVKELKDAASKLKPVVPPAGYVLSSYSPTKLEQIRNAVANTAIGHSLEQTMPKVADALHMRPSETVNSPTYAQHKDQLVAPEYATDAVSKLIPAMLGQSDKERMEGALRGVGGLTSGKSMATMAGTAAAAALTAGVINPASAQVLSRLVSGGFTLDMLHGLYQQSKEYRKAVDEGDMAEAHKIQGEMGVTGIMALLTGKHALTSHPFTPIAPKDVPTRARANVLYRSPMGEVRQAKGEAPSVWMSPDAWKSFMGALYPEENHLATNGLNLPADDRLLGFVQDTNFASDPNMAEVQKILGEAHKVADKGGVAVGSKTGRGVQHAVNVMREELNHTWQRKLTDSGNYDEHLKPGVFSHLNRNIPQGMYDHLIDNGYDEYNSPQMASEAAVKLMDGRPERFGVTDDQAVDYLDNYFNEVANQHGAQALESLKHVRGSAAETKARIIDEHNRLANRGTDGGTFQGVADRGQGSAAQSLPSEGGKVNDDQLGTASGRGVSGVAGGGQAGLATPAQAVENSGQATVNPSATGELATNAVQPGSAVPAAIPGGTGTPEDTLFNREQEKPTWYLKSERLIDEKMKGSQPADAVRKMLISGGVKPEEMQWTGLDDFLGSKGNMKVTPDEVKKYLAENSLKLNEVTKGDELKVRPSEDYEGEFEVVDKNGRVRFGGDSKEEAQDYADAENRRATKYESYVLPNGENYREMLLTAPVLNESPHSKALTSFREKMDEKYDGRPYGNLSPEEQQELTRLTAANDAAPAPTYFHSSHWDEPNIIAHIRYNDRTIPARTDIDLPDVERRIMQAVGAKDAKHLGSGAPGAALHKGLIDEAEAAAYSKSKGYRNPELNAKADKKLLHLEEVQSDWHQQGRSEGYKDDAEKERLKELAKQLVVAYGKMKEAGGQYRAALKNDPNFERIDSPEMRALHDKHVAAEREHDRIEKEIASASEGKVPDAPFKKTWHEMALRRMVKHAVENGYDGLSWTPGEAQAKRYDLSKKISRVKLHENRLTAYNHDDYTVHDETYPDTSKIADVIGKDAAEKLNNAEPDRFGVRQISGLDLKVGGEGMHGFYNKIIPEYLNKFGKKFGAQVDKVPLPTYDDEHDYYSKGGKFWVQDGDSDVAGPFNTRQEAAAKVDELNEASSVVQYLPITPEMRESLGKEGVPLFNREQVKTPEFKKWFGDSKAVDKDGEPQVLYHGTPSRETINEFKVPEDGQREGSVIWLTPNKSYAASYGARGFEPDESGIAVGKNKAHVIPVYARSVNPFDVENKADYAKYKREQEKTGALSVVDYAKQNGYDSVRFNKSELAVFDPKQVKSAIGNSGAFDPKDPNILRNREKASPAADGKDKAEEKETKYKFGSTQANLPEGSPAHGAILSMQNQIPADDLAGKGKDVDEPHVTLRYGLKTNLTPELRKFIESQPPFEASIGATTSFPPSEYSDGASPIVAAVESPELHRLNKEIEEQGEFEPSSFPEYKPHVTVAYVKPESAKKYTGMKDAEGKKFPINSIAVSDRDGNKVDITLKGETPDAEQDSPTDLDANTNVEGEDGTTPEQAGTGTTGGAPNAIIPVQGGTVLASAPVQNIPVARVHVSAPHVTERSVTVPLETALGAHSVQTTRILPREVIMAMARQQNPSRTVGSVRELIKEAKERMGNKVVP